MMEADTTVGDVLPTLLAWLIIIAFVVFAVALTVGLFRLFTKSPKGAWVSTCLVLFVCTGLCPPWVQLIYREGRAGPVRTPLEWSFLWQPPGGNCGIDLQRLLVEWAMIIALVVGGVVMGEKAAKKEGGEEEEEHAKTKPASKSIAKS